VIVSLTDQGKRLIDRARHAHGDSVHEKVGPFASNAERRHVATFLNRLAARSGRVSPGSEPRSRPPLKAKNAR